MDRATETQGDGGLSNIPAGRRKKLRLRTRRLYVLGVVAVIVAFGIATSAYLFVWPRTDDVRHADAVVVFGASAEERLIKGLELMNAGVAPVLVVSAPPRATDLCSRRSHFRVICVEPNPFTTRGEAEAVGRLAGAEGWKTVVLVSSDYHVTRAHLLLARCYEGNIDLVAAESELSSGERIEKILHEWGGLTQSLLTARGC